MKAKMTPRQKLFSEEYLLDFNATEAAKRAGVPEKSAASQGCQMLQNPRIQARIEERMQSRLRAIGVSAEKVLAEIADIALVGVEKYSGDNKLKALELLGKYLKLWQENQVGVQIVFDTTPHTSANRPANYEDRFTRDAKC